MTLVVAIQQGLSRLWRSDRTLTATALLMLGGQCSQRDRFQRPSFSEILTELASDGVV